MHMTYKQDFYKNKWKEIYDFFLEYLVTVMDDLENPARIEECKKILMLMLMKKIYTNM